MKKFTITQLIVAMVFLANFSFGQIISQYVETNSGSTPKGVEIWNNTGSTLDFATNNLVIMKGTNGGAPATDYTLSSGTLADGDVIVIGTADMEATAIANGALFYLKAFSFNGDDALEVWYGVTKTDVFGTPGSDPGSEWVGNGVSTKNQNIALLSGITTGDTDGWTDPSTRFETISTDPSTLPAGLDGFGIAPAGGAPPTIAAPSFSPGGGTYYSAVDVSMSTTTAGADIYYTLDGITIPDNTSLDYSVTGPVNVAATTTIIAVAYDGANYSATTTGTFTIESVVQVADLAALRAQADDNTTVYELTGEALLTYQQSFRNKKYIQDATAAVEIDDPSGMLTTAYNIGDGISNIFGKLNTYNGVLQFVPIMDAGAASSTGNAITPMLISADEFNNNHEMYECRLVKIDNLTFADAGGTFETATNYITTNQLGTDVLFRTNFYGASYIGTTIPTGAKDIVGIVYEFNGTPQFTARETTDIVSHDPVIPVGSTGIIIAGLLMAAVIVVRRGKLF